MDIYWTVLRPGLGCLCWFGLVWLFRHSYLSAASAVVQWLTGQVTWPFRTNLWCLWMGVYVWFGLVWLFRCSCLSAAGAVVQRLTGQLTWPLRTNLWCGCLCSNRTKTDKCFNNRLLEDFRSVTTLPYNLGSWGFGGAEFRYSLRRIVRKRSNVDGVRVSRR